MTKESGTRCSNCGQNGHNSRTCNDKLCLKLFGVKILKHKKDESMKKSFSMGNLQASGVGGEDGNAERGYLSDGGLARSRKDGAHERKKGIPWTEEEHRTFLAGLEKLGKGDWRGISKQFVMTRTPSQVASHAQKYFLRQTTTHKKYRRSSVFDMEVKDVGHKLEAAPAMPTIQNNNLAKQLSLGSQQNPSAPIASQIAPQSMQAIPAAPIPAACNIPSFCGYPYMAGMSNTRLSYSRAKVYPQISFVPVVNYYSNGYAVQPNSYSEFAARTPMVSQSSINPSSLSASNCIKKVEPPSSSTVNTDLGLSISPPQVDCSGVIRVT